MQTDLSRGEQTRLQIIEAAYQLFLEQGYHGTSMRQIARRAGIALGGTYNHFSGKEEIFEAVFFAKHPYRSIGRLLQEIQGDDIEALFEALGLQIWQMITDREGIFKIIFIEIVEFKSAHVQQVLDSLFPVVLAFVDRLRQMSAELREIASPVLARALIGTLMSMQLTEMVMKDQFDEAATRAYIRDTLNIFLYGILADSKRTL